MEVLRAENLYKIYGSGQNRVEAIRNVSFTVKRGEFVAIMGPSGSGKSTLLHILGGVDSPTKGKVFIDGTDIYKYNDDDLAIFRRRQVGIVYQFNNLLRILNVEENLALPALLDGRHINKTRIEEILKLLNLDGKAKAYPSELSGGQQQRVSIGRALINAPAIVLADEPTGNLDSKNSQDIVQLFKKSNRKYKQTLIMITHDEEVALQADRIIQIDDGEIVRDEEKR